MAKYTATKMARLFVEDMNKLFKRYSPVPAKARFEKGCLMCHTPMLVSDGQVAYYHKECRKNRKLYRSIIKRSK